MAVVKLNKTELKTQKYLLNQLTKYLPTLQLKKQQLQSEVEIIKGNEAKVLAEIERKKTEISKWSVLLSQKLTVNVYQMVQVEDVVTEVENIAGVDVPVFQIVAFREFDYSFFIKPIWVDKAKRDLRALVVEREKLKIIRKRLEIIAEELRQTSIKVNLFEKRLIPECKENIKKIKIFLGDQEIAAICNAKIAKDKLKRKDMAEAV
jgi:V/A-type H+/Na+-transporting ATPase subunit D